jgi:phosphoribosylformylglycinamidine synthase
VRNLACAGAEPVGLTDCLNFGNPERPEVAWQFREAVSGMAAACRALAVPVVSGNVSFYNETADAGGARGVHPTPTVAMVGVVPELAGTPRSTFTAAGDRVVLLGEDRGEHGGSAYLRLLFGVEQGRPPAVDLEAEGRLAELLRTLAFNGLVHTAHDLAEGGLLVALAEACFGAGLGARVAVPLAGAALFSETQARALVACAPRDAARVLALAEDAGVPAREAGEVGGGELVVAGGGETVRASVAELHEAWATGLPRALGL